MSAEGFALNVLNVNVGKPFQKKPYDPSPLPARDRSNFFRHENDSRLYTTRWTTPCGLHSSFDISTGVCVKSCRLSTFWITYCTVSARPCTTFSRSEMSARCVAIVDTLRYIIVQINYNNIIFFGFGRLFFQALRWDVCQSSIQSMRVWWITTGRC